MSTTKHSPRVMDLLPGWKLSFTPRYLLYDDCNDLKKPPGLLRNVGFGALCTFTAANLYYCQPILIQFALSFNVSLEEVSQIPTLVQAGYAVGLLLISPLGDLLRRRPLIISLLTTSTSFTIGLAVTNSLPTFKALNFLVGMASVTPQILIPLAADLAPIERRASAISILFSGLLLGILIARVLAGMIAQYQSWRVVYYFAVAMQALSLVGVYFTVPDYPSKNINGELTYFKIWWTMGRFIVTEPVLVQACLINIGANACFTNYWVTLTFLLGGPPYDYSTLKIGLFGLIGISGVLLGPVVGHVIDGFVPWYTALFAIFMLMVAQAIQLGAGGIFIAAVIISLLGLDLFDQVLQTSLTVGVFRISTEATSRLNALLILSIFIGQVFGTAAGSHIFVKFGWRAGAAFSLCLYAVQLLVLLARGPHCKGFSWLGYEGGWKPIMSQSNQQTTELQQTPNSTGAAKGEIDHDRQLFSTSA